jgi:hypothetical protein
MDFPALFRSANVAYAVCRRERRPPRSTVAVSDKEGASHIRAYACGRVAARHASRPRHSGPGNEGVPRVRSRISNRHLQLIPFRLPDRLGDIRMLIHIEDNPYFVEIGRAADCCSSLLHQGQRHSARNKLQGEGNMLQMPEIGEIQTLCDGPFANDQPSGIGLTGRFSPGKAVTTSHWHSIVLRFVRY